MATVTENGKRTTEQVFDLERELAILIVQYLNEDVASEQLALQFQTLKERTAADYDDQGKKLIDDVEKEFDAIKKAREELKSKITTTRSRLDREIELTQTRVSPDGNVGSDDDVVVALKSITINEFFSDAGDKPAPKFEDEQDVITTLIVNGQENSVAFKRSKDSFRPRYERITNSETRVLFIGKPRGLLDLDFGVIESEERERELLIRIEELLKTASNFAGYVPVYGTAIGAGLSLGAAIAALIRSALRDDKELRFLGVIGGQDLDLKYGDYSLKRGRRLGGPIAAIDIDIQFSVEKLVRVDVAHRNITILLKNAEYTPGTSGIEKGERILLDATITGAPEATDDTEIRVAGFQVEQEYIDRERGINVSNVLKINEKLLYDGPWGANLAYSFSFSAFPFRLFGQKELLDVLSQTGALISTVVDPEKAEDVRRGFEIAQSAASVVIKYAPERLFSVSKSGIFFEGTPIASLGDLVVPVNPTTVGWQPPQEVELDLGSYGKLTLTLLIRVASEIVVPSLPVTLFHDQTTNADSDTFEWPGGAGTVEAYGVWEGAKITLQQSADRRAWTDVEILTSNEIDTFEFIAPKNYLRAKLQDRNTNTKLTCVLNGPNRDQLLAGIRSVS